MHVLVQGPQVALAPVGGAPLALLAAPVLLTLVQQEELVGGPAETEEERSSARAPRVLAACLAWKLDPGLCARAAQAPCPPGASGPCVLPHAATCWSPGRASPTSPSGSVTGSEWYLPV